MGGEKPKRMWWNDEREAAVRRNEGTLNGVLVASDKKTKKNVLKRTERGEVKRCIIHSRRKVNKQFGRKTDEDVVGEVDTTTVFLIYIYK